MIPIESTTWTFEALSINIYYSFFIAANFTFTDYFYTLFFSFFLVFSCPKAHPTTITLLIGCLLWDLSHTYFYLERLTVLELLRASSYQKIFHKFELPFSSYLLCLSGFFKDFIFIKKQEKRISQLWWLLLTFKRGEFLEKRDLRWMLLRNRLLNWESK